MKIDIDAALDDPAYARSDVAAVSAALERLRCTPSEAFRAFYERKAGPFSGSHWGFALLIYDCASDAVFNMDLEGGDRRLGAGPAPTVRSADTFERSRAEVPEALAAAMPSTESREGRATGRCPAGIRRGS